MIVSLNEVMQSDPDTTQPPPTPRAPTIDALNPIAKFYPSVCYNVSGWPTPRRRWFYRSLDNAAGPPLALNDLIGDKIRDSEDGESKHIPDRTTGKNTTRTKRTHELSLVIEDLH